MEKRIVLIGILLISLVLTGCSGQKKNTLPDAYDKSYIENNGGHLWQEYGVLLETVKTSAGENVEKGSLSFYKGVKENNRDYKRILNIGNDKYEEKDFLLAVEQYLYIFHKIKNKNTIIYRYDFNNIKANPIILNKEELGETISIFGYKDGYIYGRFLQNKQLVDMRIKDTLDEYEILNRADMRPSTYTISPFCLYVNQEPVAK